MQDSINDWEHEAPLMREVYKNGLVTIAATGAHNSSEGCFFERYPGCVKPLKVAATLDVLAKGVFYCVDKDMWARGVERSPIGRRAWVIQERLLSPRLIHFGRSQIFWECGHLNACETFPRGMPEENETLRWQCFLKDIHKFRDVSDFRFEQWNSICFAYMQGGLTKITDKNVAFAGIAKEIQALMDDDYFAGLWGCTLLRGLCWFVRDYRQANGGLSFRPKDYRAPSWSFLSIEGTVEAFCRRSSDSDLLEISDVQVLPIGRDQTTGPMTGGHIQARGFLQPTTWRPGLDPHTISSWVFDNIVVDFGIQLFLDESPSVAVLAQNLYWVPVSRYSYKQSARELILGLILESTGKQETEFRRRGMFELRDDNLFPLMFRRRKGILPKEEQRGADFVYRPEEWEDMPKTEFTIV